MNILNIIEHKINSLHVYCKLRKLGVSKKTAKKLSSVVEHNCIYKLIYNKEYEKSRYIQSIR